MTGSPRRDGRSITSIAFDHGFNSSAHFSTLFRRKYGVSPRDVSQELASCLSRTDADLIDPHFRSAGPERRSGPALAALDLADFHLTPAAARQPSAGSGRGIRLCVMTG